MDKKIGIMAYAIIGAENAHKIARTKRFKIEAILRDQVITKGLTSKTLEELDGMANDFGVAEERAQRFIDRESNSESIAK